jgi:hypothetical protein
MLAGLSLAAFDHHIFAVHTLIMSVDKNKPGHAFTKEANTSVQRVHVQMVHEIIYNKQ